ncbi:MULTISPECIES: hypothetical protein [unclassified Sphingobium]|uniref:hypothetical protein n=1 Tax=unclassified Sphingobium TaxID=2611147 RepID=UPI0035A5D8FF
MQDDRHFRTRNLFTIIGAALVIGGGALAAGLLTDRPAVVKPATGTAQAMALAADKPATR